MIEVTEDVDWVPEGFFPVIYCGNILIVGENCDKYIRVCKVALIQHEDMKAAGGQYPSVEQEKEFFHFSTCIFRSVERKVWFKVKTVYDYVYYPDQVTQDQLSISVGRLKARYNQNSFRGIA